MTTLRVINNNETRTAIYQVLGGYEIKEELKKMGFRFGENSIGEKLWYKEIGYDFTLGYAHTLYSLGVAGA